jgi:Mn2+/Fe2+ NRAMP family transporter
MRALSAPICRPARTTVRRCCGTLPLLIPVLYVNQEMVLRLGAAVSGVGHARLILERFGRFWGAFSVIDLFLLNGLTIITEFIGISPWRSIISAC